MAMTNLEKIIIYMIKNRDGNVYRGNIRKYMEQIGGSGGPLYTKLYDMGFEKNGKGPRAEWVIPESVIREFGGK